MQDLMGDGFNVTEHRQGFASMANPTKEFDRLIIGGKIQHGANPVLNWMAGNAAVEIDSHENMKPCKKRSTERIDGIVAAVMAVGRAMAAINVGSVYDSRGIASLGATAEPVAAAPIAPAQWGGNWGNDED
jgi:phage terminase large subunit-like protein